MTTFFTSKPDQHVGFSTNPAYPTNQWNVVAWFIPQEFTTWRIIRFSELVP